MSRTAPSPAPAPPEERKREVDHVEHRPNVPRKAMLAPRCAAWQKLVERPKLYTERRRSTQFRTILDENAPLLLQAACDRRARAVARASRAAGAHDPLHPPARGEDA